MRKLFQWIVSVGHHWGVLVTGGVLIGGLGVWQGTEHHVSPSVYWLVAALGLITAFYRAWAVEHDTKNDGQKTISAQATRLAEQEERYKETIERSRSAELRLNDEVARLHALQLQPRFRFVANRRSFGSEECDALELWNDGGPIELISLIQASYIELSFVVDPSTPGAGAQFDAATKARYGCRATEVFGSVLEERVNVNYAQELTQHPANPLGLEHNATYTLSLQDEWDLKYVADAWDQFLMPLIEHLGIARQVDPGTAAFALVTSPEQTPVHPHVRYIPAFYYHRRTYESSEQPGRLVTLYAWQDGNPGTNYTREFARLKEEIRERFGLDKVTVSRRTFLSLVYTDFSGTRCDCTFDVYPRDPWGAVTAKRVTEPLALSRGFEVDMTRITGDSVLWFCSVPPALRSLSREPKGASQKAKQQ